MTFLVGCKSIVICRNNCIITLIRFTFHGINASIPTLSYILKSASHFFNIYVLHDDVIQWKHFPRYWPICAGNSHRSPVNSPQKDQWCGALMFSLICARISSCANNGDAGDLRRNRAHCDVIVMLDERCTETRARIYTHQDITVTRLLIQSRFLKPLQLIRGWLWLIYRHRPSDLHQLEQDGMIHVI